MRHHRILLFPALLLICGACAHVEDLEPAAVGVTVNEPNAPTGCLALGAVRGVEDDSLPRDARIRSAVTAMRNEAARRGATRVDRTTVELSETDDGHAHAVAFGLAYRCQGP